MWWLWTSYMFPFLPSSYFPQVTVTTSCHHVQKHGIALTSWKRQVTRKQRPGPKKNVTCPGNLGACWLPSESFSWCPLQQNHRISLICPCQDGLRTQWCGHEGERRKEEKEVLVIVAVFPVISFYSPTKNTGSENWAQNCSKQPASAPLCSDSALWRQYWVSITGRARQTTMWSFYKGNFLVCVLECSWEVSVISMNKSMDKIQRQIWGRE